MAYVALYRKWRPQTFDDVVGQSHVVRALTNSLDSGRISHAYLFTGPRGTGKTTVARLLAKGLNCQAGPSSSPCGECSQCLAISAGASLNIVEVDGASNRGIEDVRELRSQVQFTPINARYKVYIIDEVHMLTAEAFNALLKTLEEPPAHAIFIFATTDPHKLPPTILSRVQRYDFQRFRPTDLITRLENVAQAEQLKTSAAALELIATHAEGSMRDALGILEKCAAYAQEISASSVAEVLGIAPRAQVLDFIERLFAAEKVAALQTVTDLYDEGKDLSQFVRSTLVELRQDLLEEKEEEPAGRLRIIEILGETLREMRFAPDPRIPLEIAVLKITVADPEENAFVQELEEKVMVLEKELTKLASLLKEQQKAAPASAEMAAAASPKPLKNDEELSSFIRENWQEYLQALKNERLMQCEAFLKEAVPLQVDGETLTVAFPRDRGFHKASIEQESHRLPSERVLSQLAGTALSLHCVFSENDSQNGEEKDKPSKKQEKEAEQSASPQLTAEEKEFIAASKEIFGGEVYIRSRKE